ncbi:MAG: RNA methyltransferase [Saprospiraceae bacterium]|nr:RNA methyltransferase [Saprospiraceae bacterium]
MRKLKLDELNRVDVDTFKSQSKLPLVVVLDNIRSAHNVGSIFRTCDGFAIDHLYLCGITARPPHKEINKTAIGATSSVDWTYSESITSTLAQLKSDGYVILSVEQTDNSTVLQDFRVVKDSKYAIILGNEVEGVSDDAINLSDLAVEIPQYGTKHSFNVAVCAGICLYHFSNGMR